MDNLKTKATYRITFQADEFIGRRDVIYTTPSYTVCPIEYLMDFFVNYCIDNGYHNVYINKLEEV